MLVKTKVLIICQYLKNKVLTMISTSCILYNKMVYLFKVLYKMPV